jgi:hypothetical protein
MEQDRWLDYKAQLRCSARTCTSCAVLSSLVSSVDEGERVAEAAIFEAARQCCLAVFEARGTAEVECFADAPDFCKKSEQGTGERKKNSTCLK